MCAASKLKATRLLAQELSTQWQLCPWMGLPRVQQGMCRGDRAKQGFSLQCEVQSGLLLPSWIFQSSLHVPSCPFPHPLANSDCKPGTQLARGFPWASSLGRGSASPQLEARTEGGQSLQRYLGGPLLLPLFLSSTTSQPLPSFNHVLPAPDPIPPPATHRSRWIG